MKQMIKRLVKRIVHGVVNVLSKTTVGQYLYKLMVSAAMEQTVSIKHGDLSLTLSAPSHLSLWRAQTFSTKEPETLEWIDGLPEGAILWDVGANVGLYSVYAAKRRNCKVLAFEPSVFNMELLARNIFNNQANNLICIVPFALSDGLGANQLKMTTTEWGGALSTFGKDYGWDGKAIQQVFEFQTIGLTMDDAVQKLKLPFPEYIKMDVDGIEHVILKGGLSVLAQVKGILVEVNDDFHEQAEQCKKLLSDAGLVLKNKLHSEMIGNSKTGFQNTYNQIWFRP